MEDAPAARQDGADTQQVGAQDFERSAPRWLMRAGTRSWLYVGIVLWLAIVYAALASVSQLIIPLVVATVLGVLFTPLVDAMSRRGIPRRVAGTLVTIGLGVIAVGVVWLTVEGVIDQAPEIGRQLSAGFDRVAAWAERVGISLGDGDRMLDDFSDIGSWLIRGLAGSLSSVFSGAFAFLAGLLMGTFFLYYLVADWNEVSGWMGRHLGVPDDLGTSIVDDSTSAVREYFAVLSITNVIVATLIGVSVILLGLPLALPIALVTFVTAYVPYLGAIFSGAFAFLVALGAGGPGKAFILLAVVLVAQNVVETIVVNKLTSDRLSIHPIVAFGSTIVGASLAGILGATLSAPIVASVIRIVGRVRDYDWVRDDAGAGDAGLPQEDSRDKGRSAPGA